MKINFATNSIIPLIFFAFLCNSMKAQNYVYKRNLISGNLELFDAGNGNTPFGGPLMILKRDPVSGYIVIENRNKNIDLQSEANPIYGGMPYIRVIRDRQPKNFSLNYSQITVDINTINKKYIPVTRVDGLAKVGTEDILLKLSGEFENSSLVAEHFLNVYHKQVESFIPLNDGWYNTYGIRDVVRNNKNPDYLGNAKYFLTVSISKVENNKITEYYSTIDVMQTLTNKCTVFLKEKIDVTGEVNNYKTQMRFKKSSLIEEIYFIDNFIDMDYKINNPNFGFFKLSFDNYPKNRIIDITFQENENFQGTEPPESKYSLIQSTNIESNVYAFTGSARFWSIFVRDMENKVSNILAGVPQKHWIIRDFIPTPNVIKTTAISE